VILAVPDDAIGPVARAVEPGPAVMVHLSGAATLEVLAPHERRASVHPLVSLPDAEVGTRRLLGGAAFAVAGDESARAIVAALNGTAFEVPDDRRAVYHAAAAVAANHLVALCGQVERLAAAAGVPAAAYWELMALALDDVRAAGAAAALTGPAARGDLATLAAHLAALEGAEHPLYLALTDAAARLAGRPPPSSTLGV
jgi:predicted short-subunit dehydrogenase-like oxidoreductase (DUF2520 family)